MKRSHSAAALGVLAGLAIPSTAQAEPFLSKNEAQSMTKQVVKERYADEIMRPIAAECRPVGLDAPEPGYDYKFWTCDWAARSEYTDEVCGGTLRIAGHRRHNFFRWRVTRGLQCY